MNHTLYFSVLQESDVKGYVTPAGQSIARYLFLKLFCLVDVKKHINQSRVTACLDVRESPSFYVHFFFCVLFLERVFFFNFVHTSIEYNL